jgi:Glycosyl hydrolases family 18
VGRRHRLALLVAVLLVLGACGAVPPARLASPSAPLAPRVTPGPPTPPPAPGHEVYGYVPYWEMDDGIAAHVAGTPLTTLALFSVTQRRDGELAVDERGWQRIAGGVGRRLVEEAHARGTRVELVWSSFGAEKNRHFFETPEVRDRWREVLTGLVRDGGFDGVNVDVEGLPIDLIPAYAGFVASLRDGLQAMDAAFQVSVATGAGQLGAAMAGAAAAAGADRIFLMGYDYRTAGSEPGASAPLDRIDGDERSLRWSLDLYAALGVPVDRTILGLPLYGVTWPVLGPGFGAMAVGRGDAWVPRRNLEAFADPSLAPTLDPTESVEFYAVGAGDEWDAVYYDSPRSLAPKLALANERGLAGAGFWAIGYERGLPDYTALITGFRNGEVGE